MNSSLLVSLLLHVILVCFFIFSLEWKGETPVLENSDQNNKIIQASVMNMPNVEAPRQLPTPKQETTIEKPKTIPEPIKKPEIEIKQPKTDDAIAIKQKLKQAKQKQQELIEKQLLADLKRATPKKKVVQHDSLEKAFAQELNQINQSMQNQLTAKMQGIVNKYKALILQAIAQNWNVPAGVDKKLSSELLIHLGAGGTVLNVQVTRSSGNTALDSSARDAVFKASPLPVPTDSAFNEFRQFVLRVKPENVILQ